MRFLIITLFAICSCVLVGQNTFLNSQSSNPNNQVAYTTTAPDGVARFLILQDGMFTRQYNPIYNYNNLTAFHFNNSKAFFLTPYDDGDPKSTKIEKSIYNNVTVSTNFQPSPIVTTTNPALDLSWSFTDKYENYVISIFKNCAADGNRYIEVYYNDSEVTFSGSQNIIKGPNVGSFSNPTVVTGQYNRRIRALITSNTIEQRAVYIPLKSKNPAGSTVKIGTKISGGCNTDLVSGEFRVAGTPHDPNKVECLTSCVKFPTSVQQELEYKITFQNNGDGPANNVVVMDSIGFDVDPNSITILDSSHPCYLDQTYAYPGKVKFVFPNINLLGTGQFFTIAESKTIGWVKFKVCSYNPAQCVGNKAAIFFDNQAPVSTNLELKCTNGPCHTLVECGNSNNNAGLRTSTESKLTAYPNPVSNELTIETNSNLPSNISIVNSLGRTIKSMNFELTPDNVNVDMSDLSKGIYILHFESNGKIDTVKLIKQ